jgi:hypothetical protein
LYESFCIEPALDLLRKSYFQDTTAKLENFMIIVIIEGVCFLLFLLISYVLIFEKVTRVLKDELLQSKQLMTIIPIQFIQSNEDLKEAFFSTNQNKLKNE